MNQERSVMIGGMLDFLLQNLHLGADRTLLGQLLRPASAPGRPLRVLAPGGHLLRPLRAAGCEVVAPEEASLPDAICTAQAPGDLVRDLSGWAAQVREGGLVLLVTRRGRPRRQVLCAAFLHAGLTEPVQRTAGVAVVTAGRVQRRPLLNS